MPFWVLALISIALFALNRLLIPKPKRTKASPLTFPSIEEGRCLPVILGIGQVSPQVVWWGDRQTREGDAGDIQYNARVVYALCWGMVDTLMDIFIDEKSLNLNLGGSYTDGRCLSPPFPLVNVGFLRNQQYFGIDAPRLLGGSDRRGGVRGVCSFRPGNNGTVADDTNTLNPLLSTAMGFDVAYKDYALCLMGLDATQDPETDVDIQADVPDIPAMPTGYETLFMFGSNSPSAPNINFLVLVEVYGPSGVRDDYTRVNGEANPAYAIWQILTNEAWGLGVAVSELDAAMFTAAAATLAAEGFSVSVELNDPLAASDTLDDLLELIDGELQVSATDGLRGLKLARKDWFKDEIFRVHAGNASELDVSKSQWADTINEVRINYRRLGATDSGDAQTYTSEKDLNYETDIDKFFPSSWLGLSGGYYTFQNKALVTGFENITNVVVEFDSGGITGVEGTDYTVDAASGVVFIIPLHRTSTHVGFPTDPRSGAPVVITFDAPTSTNPGYRDAAATAQNLASRQAVGYAKNREFRYPWITKPTVAQLVAHRRLRAYSVPIQKARWNMTREGWAIRTGDPVWLDFPEKGIDLVVRVGEVSDGTLDGGEMNFAGIEDVFDVTEPLYPSGPTDLWIPPEPASPFQHRGWGQKWGTAYGGGDDVPYGSS